MRLSGGPLAEDNDTAHPIEQHEREQSDRKRAQRVSYRKQHNSPDKQQRSQPCGGSRLIVHRVKQRLALLHGSLVPGRCLGPVARFDGFGDLQKAQAFAPERRARVLECSIAEHPGLSVCIITKSPLITRDIDLLSRINRLSDLSIHISLITLDRDLARRIEPRAPTPESRVRALSRLREAGIEAGINCMPVLPGITDNPSDLEALVKRVSEAGAISVGACAVRLKSAAKKRYLPFIEQEFPHLAERYRNTFANSAYAGEKYREGLARFFEKLCAKYGVRGWSSREDEEGDEALGALVPPQQLSLEL